MRRGGVTHVGTNRDGQSVDVIEWLDEDGNPIRFTVEVDGEEVGDFDSLDAAIADAERRCSEPGFKP